MTTDCSPHQLEFQGLTRRMVVASFDGGTLSSDGGVLLLGEVDRRLGLLGQFAACFTDHRNPGLVEHSVPELVRQRVFGLALSYEDLNDHDELRTDPIVSSLSCVGSVLILGVPHNCHLDMAEWKGRSPN